MASHKYTGMKHTILHVVDKLLHLPIIAPFKMAFLTRASKPRFHCNTMQDQSLTLNFRLIKLTIRHSPNLINGGLTHN